MNPILEREQQLTRRTFLNSSALGIGSAALASMLPAGSPQAAFGAGASGSNDVQAALASLGNPHGGILSKLHHAPTAKRVIYLFMSGAPSQLDLFDYKPNLIEQFDKDLPDSIRMGQRITTMTSGQKRLPVAPTKYKFAQHGQSGAWLSELLPHTAGIVDDIAIIKSLHTEAINHDPAITFIQTGNQIPGRPSAGAWISYGLGSPTKDLPAFVVMTPYWRGRPEAQALYSRLWGSGWLPSKHQGVALRAKGDPVLYLSNPQGIDRTTRRKMLDGLAALNEETYKAAGDPETQARIAQYEMAFRMQTSVPELTNFKDEPKSVLDMYGPEVHKPGSFAASCVLARRLAERGVPFTQIFIRGWDHHNNLPKDLPGSCSDIDQPSAALIQDLKQRGMLDDTLVIWGGEFGRTVYCQGKLTRETYGRDHHPKCFTMWMAGGGVKGGVVHGETDDYSYNIVKDPVHIHDLNATMLHCLGVDHMRLRARFQGRDFRLTDVGGKVVKEVLG